jgi:hypothetical protein
VLSRCPDFIHQHRHFPPQHIVQPERHSLRCG